MKTNTTVMYKGLFSLQYDVEFKEFRLHSIMSEHKKTITAITWNPKDTDLLASASADNQVSATLIKYTAENI